MARLRSTRWMIIFCLCCLPSSLATGQPQTSVAPAQNTSKEIHPAPPVENPPAIIGSSLGPILLDRSDSIDQLLTHLALTKIPKEYVDTRKWGHQTQRWDGVQFDFDQGRLETHRRKKLVNDGTWTKYAASLRNPQQEFQVQVRNVKELSSGKLGFEIHVAAHVDFKAQQVKWKKGVKLLSLSAHGHAQVSIRVDMEVNIASEGKKFPPDLILSPQAKTAKIEFVDFRIDRVGKVGGEFAQQVGYEAEKRLSERLPEYEKKVIDKINAEFGKKAPGYRFSFCDLQKSKWSQSLMGVLGLPNTVTDR